MSLRSAFARPTPYLAWLVLSALWLAVAQSIDPYVFGFSAFGAAFVSGALTLVALFMGWRAIFCALMAWLPTVLAFALLGTYKWA
jgi:hypothetical protein